MSEVNKEKLALFERCVEQVKAKLGGELNAQNMTALTADEMTVMAYAIYREEMLQGGMIQLIQNGYGPFIFLNPFAKAMRLWGLKEFSKFIYEGRQLYEAQREVLEVDCSDEEFMALYEQHPEMEEADDTFIEIEPSVTEAIADRIAATPALAQLAQ